jgi:pimeloyl-ACP methyl ester carboxylesterase
VTSADGTSIAYDLTGSGPAVILVSGAFTDRAHPTLAGVASGLSAWFAVVNYDRRGRGESGDDRPYAVEREIEDLAALIDAVGGSAMVFGGSSGAALALEAAARGLAISKLALWEPPYHVDESAPELPGDFAAQLDALVRDGRPGDAVELFMVRAAEVPAAAVAAMRVDPGWSAAEAVAHTLAYEAAVLGPGNAFAAERFAAITQPTLLLTGGSSPMWMANAGKAVAKAIPQTVHRVLDGQMHNVDPDVLTAELLEFFTVG